MQASLKSKLKRTALLVALTILAACIQAALITVAHEATAEARCAPNGTAQR